MPIVYMSTFLQTLAQGRFEKRRIEKVYASSDVYVHQSRPRFQNTCLVCCNTCEDRHDKMLVPPSNRLEYTISRRPIISFTSELNGDVNPYVGYQVVQGIGQQQWRGERVKQLQYAKNLEGMTTFPADRPSWLSARDIFEACRWNCSTSQPSRDNHRLSKRPATDLAATEVRKARPMLSSQVLLYAPVSY